MDHGGKLSSLEKYVVQNPNLKEGVTYSFNNDTVVSNDYARFCSQNPTYCKVNSTSDQKPAEINPWGAPTKQPAPA